MININNKGETDMATNRIEQLIDDIYEFVEGCKAAPFAANKIQVNKEELYELLDELRSRTPDEIKRYQKIIANRDAIIADAEDKAEKIIEEAKIKASQLVGEHEIMQQAYARVNDMVAAAGEDAAEMVSKAQAEADALRTSILTYSNNVMNDMEQILLDAYESTRERSEMLIMALKDSYEAVASNRMEIYSQLDPSYVRGDVPELTEPNLPSDDEEYDEGYEESYDDGEYEEEYEDEDEEDYDFNEDTFLDNIED